MGKACQLLYLILAIFNSRVSRRFLVGGRRFTSRYRRRGGRADSKLSRSAMSHKCGGVPQAVEISNLVAYPS